MTKKILKKAAMMTDSHWGRKNGAEEHLNDCMNFIDWFCEQVKSDPKIDHIMFLGDWHEHRASIGVNTLMRSYEGAQKLDALGLPVFFASGNHDHFLRHSSDVFSTYHFSALKNFKVMNKITVLDEIYGGVLFVPFIQESEYPLLLDYKDIPVVAGHLELKGFKVTGTGNVMEHGPEADTFFKTQKRVFSGHFHARQQKGNVTFIGNIFPMDFSDANDPHRGMATYNFEEDDLQFIDWLDAPQYIKTKLSELLDDPKKTLKQNARVKVEVDTDITLEESNLIREKFQKKFNLREITLEETYSLDVQLSEEEEEIEELQLETTGEVIQELIKRIKDDSVDTDLLLKIYNKLSVVSNDIEAKAANIEFVKMTMQNYLSYGNDTTEINLNFDDPTLIVGRNYDSVVDGNIDSNGSGKSTILNGMLMCLFDKNLMNIDKNAQINKTNGKNMLLSVEFKVDGVFYRVERFRKNRAYGGDGVKIFKNDSEAVFTEDHDITPSSVALSNTLIEQIIGIPYEMFIRIVVFSATHEPFLSLPSSHASKANQRDIIEELFGLTELSLKAEKLKEIISGSKSEFKNLLQINERLQAEHDRHTKQIEDNVGRLDDWDALHKQRKDTLREQIETLEKIDTQTSLECFEELEKYSLQLNNFYSKILVLEQELKTVASTTAKSAQWSEDKKSKQDELEQKIKKLKQYDFGELKKVRDEIISLDKQYESIQNAVRQLEREKQDVQDKIKKYAVEIEGTSEELSHLEENKCPYCKQKYDGTENKIEECKHVIDTMEVASTLLEKDLSDRNAELNILHNDLAIINEQRGELRAIDLPNNIEVLENNLVTLQEQLEVLNLSENPHVVEAGELTEEELTEALSDVRSQESDVKSKARMAKEFIHPSFSSKADVLGHQTKIDMAKERLIELEKEVNPFKDIIVSLHSTQLDDLKTDEINTMDKEIKHSEFLLKLLTKKDSFIRKALLNKSIPLLNTRLRHNLDKVGLPHKVTFTEEMEVSISQFGSEYEYGNFSSGQKARVNLCLAFAFRDVLQSRFGKINLCILDECLDTGLGNVGVTQAAKMIKSIALENKLSMFIISHRDEVYNMFDKRLEIELRNSFSTILKDE